ncbi:MAG: glutamate synthase large subunit [Candidatus Omnitrophota bacterium]
MGYNHFPKPQGLYNPEYEHDSCGVGFLCNIKGKKTNYVVRQALEVLRRLSHRGATGADPKTGDGAGVLMQMPHEFFKNVCEGARIDLPDFGLYGTGLIFLPTESGERELCKKIFARIVKEEAQELLGWRSVPVDNTTIGKTARSIGPAIEQVFIARNKVIRDQLSFERVLYVIRKRIENEVLALRMSQQSFFYITNLSSRTFVYKGLLMPDQLEGFFLDLKDPAIVSALCLVHSRYSTNTFPTWNLAQPFRFLAHNGEINTLRGNINWMRARESLLASSLFGSRLKKLQPFIVPGGSDSAAIDNIFELLTLSGKDLAGAMMMLIPAAWEQNDLLNKKVRDFYRYHACSMEPWDGPAAIAFTDGTRVGAVLDRNGLRPARYIITKDDFVVMASEMGVLDIKPEDILVSGRLQPGKMFFIDTEDGRIIEDQEIKKRVAARNPYGAWLTDNVVALATLPPAPSTLKVKNAKAMLAAFGYTREDLKIIIKPMAEEGKEPIGSMGNDIPHAVLSKNPQLLYTYFKQLFAQVTNPAIDPIREELVMSLESYIGAQKNLLDETPEHCRKFYVRNPILSNADVAKIKRIRTGGFKTKTVSICFAAKRSGDLHRALVGICRQATSAIKEGFTFLVLSDRGVDEKHAAIPTLLALSALHQHLVRKSLRSRIGIIIESAEPREVHHFALLFGYGAGCINPYGAYEAIKLMITQGDISADGREAEENYVEAVKTGIMKILSKMGISTLQSYRGAQIFEALGIHQDVIDECFTGTASRIGGVDFDIIEREALLRHARGYGIKNDDEFVSGGLYQWRRDGEFHLWNPESIACLQDATRLNSFAKYQEFSRLINDQSKNPTTIRSLFNFKKQTPVSIEGVEPFEDIFKRFATGAMSFGSISKAAHETLAIAMNQLGGKSNTGEGGEDPARFVPLASGDSARSAIKQVASGRFGVTTNYLVNADELQIKIAQGAKPGEGGQLPGHKVSAIIARTRYTTPGVTLISPPPHHDIYSIEDLAQLIFDLKNVNPSARISVKLVSEVGVGTVAAGVAKGHADMILVSGGDGGTGASPLSSIKHAGLPWELGISETHQTLVLNGLRSRVRLQTDGQMRTGRDVAIAAMLGAEEFGFCTAALVISGCVMLRHCHLNNCSVGVATQDELLEHRFRGKPEYLVNYFNFVARELREIMASLGVRSLNELVGRTDLLSVNEAILPWKATGIDLSKLLYQPQSKRNASVYCTSLQEHDVDKVLDRKLIEQARQVFENRLPVKHEFVIHNTDRATGAMLSGAMVKRFGEGGLGEDTIHYVFRGVAGQSFGAFLSKGITFELEGMANDYVGKGISGGKIIIYPDTRSTFTSHKNIIIGNTTFYGAICGEAYIRGVAGERFCIRNSGLLAVVEGVGDHGCEYMTGGVVVIMGAVGRNFAAGMSGGIAYVYDVNRDFKKKCNFEMVELERLTSDDAVHIRNLLHNHYTYTKSDVSKSVFDNFTKELKHFIKVMPIEYKRVLAVQKSEQKAGLADESDG